MASFQQLELTYQDGEDDETSHSSSQLSVDDYGNNKKSLGPLLNTVHCLLQKLCVGRII